MSFRLFAVLFFQLFLLQAQKTIFTYIGANESAGGPPAGEKALEMSLSEFTKATYTRDGQLVMTVGGGRYLGRIETSGGVTVIAGNGFSSPSGNGGLAVNAAIAPSAFRYGADGNLYLSSGNGVYIIDPQGRIRQIALQ